MSSLRRGHANLLCIVPILADDLRRGSERTPTPAISTRSSHYIEHLCGARALGVEYAELDQRDVILGIYCRHSIAAVPRLVAPVAWARTPVVALFCFFETLNIFFCFLLEKGKQKNL